MKSESRSPRFFDISSNAYRLAISKELVLDLSDKASALNYLIEVEVSKGSGAPGCFRCGRCCAFLAWKRLLIER